jgi:hypothetical protein
MEKAWSKDPDAVSLWIHILMLANFQDREEMFGGKTIICKRGQFTTGRTQLVALTGIERSKIERLLKRFENEQQIKQQTSNLNRLITVLNYDKYQSMSNDTSNECATSVQRVCNECATNVHTIRIKQSKEEKELREDKKESSVILSKSDFIVNENKEKEEIAVDVASLKHRANDSERETITSLDTRDFFEPSKKDYRKLPEPLDSILSNAKLDGNKSIVDTWVAMLLAMGEKYNTNDWDLNTANKIWDIIQDNPKKYIADYFLQKLVRNELQLISKGGLRDRYLKSFYNDLNNKLESNDFTETINKTTEDKKLTNDVESYRNDEMDTDIAIDIAKNKKSKLDSVKKIVTRNCVDWSDYLAIVSDISAVVSGKQMPLTPAITGKIKNNYDSKIPVKEVIKKILKIVNGNLTINTNVL